MNIDFDQITRDIAVMTNGLPHVWCAVVITRSLDIALVCQVCNCVIDMPPCRGCVIPGCFQPVLAKEQAHLERCLAASPATMGDTAGGTDTTGGGNV